MLRFGPQALRGEPKVTVESVVTNLMWRQFMHPHVFKKILASIQNANYFDSDENHLDSSLSTLRFSCDGLADRTRRCCCGGLVSDPKYIHALTSLG